MTDRGVHTYTEIISQFDAWAGGLKAVERDRESLLALWKGEIPSEVLFVGCGSTHYLSLSAASRFQALTGVRAKGLPSSEVWCFPQSVLSEGAGSQWLVAVSRSGETTETLRCVERFRSVGRGHVLTVTCTKSRLSTMGDINLHVVSAAEKSVAQTRSFSGMLAATIALSAVLGGRKDILEALGRAPAAGRACLSSVEDVALRTAKSLRRRVYFLGSGPRYGLACEASLKLKEMSLTESEPFHYMEFRHGPKSMVDPETLVIGLPSRERTAADQEEGVVNDLKGLAGQVVSLDESLPTASLPAEVSDILFLPAVQLLAYAVAMAKGLDPDKPRNLEAVIKL